MTSNARDVSDILLETDEEYRKLKEEHHKYDDRLLELSGKPWLTTDEEVEEKKLKKHKLLLKDQMEQRVHEYQTQHSVSA